MSTQCFEALIQIPMPGGSWSIPQTVRVQASDLYAAKAMLEVQYKGMRWYHFPRPVQG